MVPSPQFWRLGSLHGPSLPPLYALFTSCTAGMGIWTPRTGRCSLVLGALVVIGASGYCAPVAAHGWSRYLADLGALGFHARNMPWLLCGCDACAPSNQSKFEYTHLRLQPDGTVACVPGEVFFYGGVARATADPEQYMFCVITVLRICAPSPRRCLRGSIVWPRSYSACLSFCVSASSGWRHNTTHCL